MTESASGTPNLSPAASEGSAMGTRSLFIGEFPTSIFGVRRHSAHVEVYIPLLITSLHNKICRSQMVDRPTQSRSIPGSIRSFAVVKFLPVFRTYEEVFFLLWLQAEFGGKRMQGSYFFCKKHGIVWENMIFCYIGDMTVIRCYKYKVCSSCYLSAHS